MIERILVRKILGGDLRADEHGKTIGRRLLAKSEIEYPDKVPPGTFDTAVPKGWKLVHALTLNAYRGKVITKK